MVNLHVKNRARWTGKFIALATAALLIAPVALAQDATPTAGGGEGDAMVRSMDPSALPEGFKVPGTATHVTNYGVHEWYQNLTKGGPPALRIMGSRSTRSTPTSICRRHWRRCKKSPRRSMLSTSHR